jgi:hypothetical protein
MGRPAPVPINYLEAGDVESENIYLDGLEAMQDAGIFDLSGKSELRRLQFTAATFDC